MVTERSTITIPNDAAYDWMFEDGTILDLTREGRERRTTALLDRWKDQPGEEKTLQGIMLIPHAQGSMDSALIGIIFHFGRVSDRLDAIYRIRRINWLGEVMCGMRRGTKSYQDAMKDLNKLEAKQAQYEKEIAA